MPFIEYNKKKVLFVHIPKTGGSSTERWLESIAKLRCKTSEIPAFIKCTPQHLTLSELQELFGESYFDYTFSIVRHPYTRLESEYRWRFFTRQTALSFSAWSTAALETYRSNSWYYDNHFRPQVEFLGTPIRLYRFEDGLQQILQTVSAETGIPSPQIVPREKWAGGSNPQLIWTPELRLAVHEIYRQDFIDLHYDPWMNENMEIKIRE